MSDLLVELPACPDQVAPVRRAVEELAAQDRFDEAQTNSVVLAVSEAAANVVLHAYRDRSVPGVLRLSAQLGESGLVVEVCDEGRGIAARADSPGMGMGLALIAALSRTVDIHSTRRGTRVSMSFAAHAA
jgi:serine/threonine-protein kinase RsbW